MSRIKRFTLPLILAVLSAIGFRPVAAAEMPLDEAWKALPKYEHGQDMAALLAIDRAVIEAMAAPEKRSACAARLAALLVAEGTTPAARQYVCLQLRQVGTPAEVPVLGRLLARPETCQMARYALEAIPGDESLAALRGGLATLKGKMLVGVVNSLAARKDTGSVEALIGLADANDKEVARAALWALGNIAEGRAAEFLIARAEKAGAATPPSLAVPLLRCADALHGAGKKEQARAIYEKLGAAGQARGTRRAALESLLGLDGQPTGETVLAWFGDADPDRRLVAAGHLGAVSDAQLDKLAVVELLTTRRGKEVLPLVMSMARSDKPELRLAGVRCLGLLGDTSTIPFLLDALAAEGPLAEAAQDALRRLPRKEVGPALLDALQNRPGVRTGVIEVLKRLRYYEAIDPLIVIARDQDPAVYGPALDGLRGIADPDKTDTPRLVKLLLATPRGKQRDEVEKTILIVCEKLPKGANRAEPVIDALAKVDPSQAPNYLPLLGRLGGPHALKVIRAALSSTEPQVQEAAVRALCNWPDASVADKLLELAGSDNKAFRQWALRAYVRVVTLESDRPEARTLAMLRSAMKLAQKPEDRQLIVRRAGTVRTMEAVDWIAGYLDDSAVAQAACEAIVELAHHRFLRHPNMKRFDPILQKVGKISKDAAVVERARRYRLGL